MSKIDNLLSELCPDGVKQVSLSEVGSFVRGQGLQKIDFTESGLPCIHYGQIYTHYKKYVRKTKSFVSPKLAEKLKSAPHGSLIITTTSENVTDVATAVVWLGDGNVVFGGHSCALIHDENPMYLAHVFQNSAFQFQKNALVQGTKVKDISVAKLGSVKVPLPPRKVQDEIARILDTFQELETELETELEARKIQYDFYTDQLLGFGNESLKWVRFGDVATILRGASPRPIQEFITDSDDGVPWIKIGDTTPGEKYVTSTGQKITEEGAKNSRFISPGDFILSNSMSFGRPYISKIRGCIHDGWLAISDFEDDLNTDYLYHVLQSHAMQMEFSQRASSGTVSNLNADIVKSVQVPLPPIEEQIQIARVLNNFESILNSNVQGLPAEIEARRQQYEYYRNKLLTFKELEVV